MTLLERIGVESPVVQAGMGGGIARHELAAAVSAAGGLGTIGMPNDAQALRRELAAARERTERPVAVNLLLPFARRAHWEAATGADVVVTFWGDPVRRHGGVWLHQAGSVDEALRARAAGADGVIVQGVEAGGHVRGREPAHALLAAVRAAVGAGYPLWLAGGVAEPDDVAAALEAGAEAAVAGTRFLMSEESRAHPQYRARVGEAKETILTELFGAGWPAPHRVVANAATRRWLRAGADGPAWVRAAQRITAPALRAAPLTVTERVAALQRPGAPLLAPLPPTDDGPASLVESGPLYAGETAARTADVRPAAELTRWLAGVA